MSNELMTVNDVFALAQQNTFSNQGITNLLKGHEDRISKMESVLTDHANRITSFEENERIDGVDARRIKMAIATRCDYLLGIHRIEGLPTKESLPTDKRFSSRFRRRAYTDCKSHSRMATDYRETKKRDLDELMDYIEGWQPEVSYEGLTGTKAYIRYLLDRDNA